MKYNVHCLALMLAGLLGCQQSSTAASDPAESGLTFIGGADGGVYIKLADDNNPNDNVYQGTIYYDDKSTIWYDGPLQSMETTQSLAPKNAFDPTGWDGENLHLSDGGYLKPLNEVK